MTEQTYASRPASVAIPRPMGTGRVANIPNRKFNLRVLPGLTGPIFLVGKPHSKTAHKPIWRDILALAVDILHLREWRKADPISCVMLAGYTAALTQPLIYGNLGTNIVALMTPVK